jgi:hypothetical protein
MREPAIPPFLDVVFFLLSFLERFPSKKRNSDNYHLGDHAARYEQNNGVGHHYYHRNVVPPRWCNFVSEDEPQKKVVLCLAQVPNFVRYSFHSFFPPKLFVARAVVSTRALVGILP